MEDHFAKNKRSGFGADLEGHSGNFSDEPLLSLTLAAQRFIHSPGTTSNELKVRTLDLTPPNMRQVDFEGVVPILFFFFRKSFWIPERSISIATMWDPTKIYVGLQTP